MALYPDTAAAWGMKGEYHFVQGQISEAKGCFEKALAIDANEPRSRSYSGEIEKIEKGGK